MNEHVPMAPVTEKNIFDMRGFAHAVGSPVTHAALTAANETMSEQLDVRLTPGKVEATGENGLGYRTWTCTVDNHTCYAC